MCSASLFKLLLFVLRAPFRKLLAVRIYHSKTSPMWLAVGRFLIHIIQLALCVCRFCDIWLWSNSWKAFESSLIAPSKLFQLSDFIRWMLLVLPVNFLNKNIKESVSKECAISMWIERLQKQTKITPSLFNSFLWFLIVKGPNRSKLQYVNEGGSWSVSDDNSDIYCFPSSPPQACTCYTIINHGPFNWVSIDNPEARISSFI